ncbi:20S proteasome subunit alpha 6 [Enteropsectra breve]|nr:20S proteasome subunit alpha 6 [Enteropsectra breve]
MAGAVNYEHYLMYNPEGHVKQMEFARKSSELGSTCLALCNKRVGVIVAHIPLRSKLAEPQDKVFKISDKAQFAFAGITNDGLLIVDYLKQQVLQEEVLKERPIHHLHVFDDLCADAASCSLQGHKRMLGAAGMLMMDFEGIKITEFDPMGLALDVVGVAIGNRSQSCRTILEEKCDSFSDCSLEELISIGISALTNAYPDPQENLLHSKDVYIHVIEADKGVRTVDAREYME